MGIFDIFTGDPVKDAANKNADLYQQNQQQGLGYLDSGYNSAHGNLTNAVTAYTPLANIGGTLDHGVNSYMDALGINGASGTARAQDAFTASPGYQFQMGQGLQAVDRGAASRGMLGSGNTLMAEQKYGSDLANQEWQQHLTNLGGFINPTIQATAGAGYGQAQGYTGLANLGQNDALNRVNLGTTTTSGLANSNMQSAQAQMQGSGNLFNFGLGLAKLGVGAAFPGGAK